MRLTGKQTSVSVARHGSGERCGHFRAKMARTSPEERQGEDGVMENALRWSGTQTRNGSYGEGEEEFHCINHRQPITAEPFARQTNPPFFPNPLWMCSLSVFRTDLPPRWTEFQDIPGITATRWMDFSKEKRSLKNGRFLPPPLRSPAHVRDKMQIPRSRNLTSGRVLIARTKTLERSN